MKLTTLGGARTVTDRCTCSNTSATPDRLRSLPGQARESPRQPELPFDPRKLMPWCSPTHIDHSGNIPSLVKQGFMGRSTAPTPMDLATIMLLDSGHIQEKDVEFVNKTPQQR